MLTARNEGQGSRFQRRLYLPVRLKFVIALTAALLWCGLSVWLSLKWIDDLSALLGRPLAIFVIAFIAYVPGFMNAFLATTILLDRRPERRAWKKYPDLTVLVACYNEATNVADTIRSLAEQEYSGRMRILVLDDGSTDDTIAVARTAIAAAELQPGRHFQIVEAVANVGKAGVLNRGLAMTETEIVLTLDGDSWVFFDAIRHLVERYLGDPPNTCAVAGAVLVRNSRASWLTRAQEWDYFHGIAAVKRMQSMYHGTLVAQGAFSLYERAALEEVGGWPDCVGEDIVITWAFLARDYRVGYCEDALLFTNVPERLNQFWLQRKRWSRGMIEAFKHCPSILFKARLTTLFIWWNLLFIPLDFVYTFAFLPGVVLALFGYYYIAGIMTLLVLPLAAIWNSFIFVVQRRMFRHEELKVRRNLWGFLIYLLAYSILMQPICVAGYITEVLGWQKRWGTK